MSLRLNGSTSGYVEIDAPAVAGTTSITVPATSGEALVKAADGSVDLGGVDIDSSGRLLVGTSTARPSANGVSAGLQVEGTGANGALSIIRNGGLAYLTLGRSGGSSVGSNIVVSNGDELGRISWAAADGTDIQSWAADIKAEIDGTPGPNDVPGRLVFSTTVDGESSPTERFRISSGGALYQNFSIRRNTGVDFSQFASSVNALPILELYATDTFYNDSILQPVAARSANVVFSFLSAFTSNVTDREFNLRGDGVGLCDQSWNGGGADYAEYFEWSDGNITAEDRRGISVVLDGDKIREAVFGEDPIGVISGNPSVVGDSAWNKWIGKYLRDDYGSYVLDENGERQLNPAYDPDVEYISREDRPEWDCVGLMGKLRIRKGQVTGARWIKMRDISDSVEEWLVR